MMLINKVKSDADIAQAPKAEAKYIVTLTWTGDADLDLWVQDPANHIAGFNNREGGQGSLLSLNRDCLGARTTEVNQNGEIVNTVNEEIVSIRGTVEGEYIVNAHAYNVKGSTPPIKGTVRVIQIKPYKEFVMKEKNFMATGDELTFTRFTVDKQGNVSSVNDLPTSILRQGNTRYGGGSEGEPPSGELNMESPSYQQP